MSRKLIVLLLHMYLSESTTSKRKHWRLHIHISISHGLLMGVHSRALSGELMANYARV
jgi:hypothetical protein